MLERPKVIADKIYRKLKIQTDISLRPPDPPTLYLAFKVLYRAFKWPYKVL